MDVEEIKEERNLLAFSAGVDSSALFFLLLEHNIKFDIALINYGIRDQAKDEEAHALLLANRYNLKVHIAHAPTFKNNFEKNARDFRYAFFDELMENYDNLLTAHHLNDQLEWFLMRLTKGAGVTELMGLERVSKRKDYRVIRPLLEYSKEELLTYLEQHQHPYFIDESNFNDKYERNIFRNKFANELIENYKDGIVRSFNYLNQDKKSLMEGYRKIYQYKQLYILEVDNLTILPRIVDKYLKKLGYLLSASQRNELNKESSIVFGGLWAVEVSEDRVYIAPYKRVSMSKKFKEECRVCKIPSKIRPYLYDNNIEPTALPMSS